MAINSTKAWASKKGIGPTEFLRTVCSRITQGASGEKGGSSEPFPQTLESKGRTWKSLFYKLPHLTCDSPAHWSTRVPTAEGERTGECGDWNFPAPLPASCLYSEHAERPTLCPDSVSPGSFKSGLWESHRPWEKRKEMPKCRKSILTVNLNFYPWMHYSLDLPTSRDTLPEWSFLCWIPSTARRLITTKYFIRINFKQSTFDP